MIIRQLVYLDALAREKHFRRAAEACHVSQPTLSAAIVQLEEELGVLIVERGRRFQGFTKEGEVVLAHARRILAEAEVMKDSIAELREGVSGRIRLGAIPTALPMIAHITAPFSERYPAVSLTVLSLTSQEIQQGIDDFELDVGLTYLDNEPLDRVISKPIYQESYVLLTREDGPFGARDTITWAEAAEQKLCLLTGDMQNRRHLPLGRHRAAADDRDQLDLQPVLPCRHPGRRQHRLAAIAGILRRASRHESAVAGRAGGAAHDWPDRGRPAAGGAAGAQPPDDDEARDRCRTAAAADRTIDFVYRRRSAAALCSAKSRPHDIFDPSPAGRKLAAITLRAF